MIYNKARHATPTAFRLRLHSKVAAVLSVAEHRLLLVCFTQIGREATDERLYRVYARDIAELADIPAPDAYHDAAVAAERLYERSMEVFEGPNGTAPPKKRVKANSQDTPKGDSKGAIYGIPMAAIKTHAKPGESDDDAALRLLDEAHMMKT